MENNSTDKIAGAAAAGASAGSNAAASVATDAMADMMAEARNAQFSALTFLGEGSVRAIAPAKANLFLGIGERLADGYHEATTVMHALALHDTLHINCLPLEDEAAQISETSQIAVGGPSENLQVSITIDDKTAGIGRALESPDIPVAENLVFKAVDALAKKIGWDAPQVVKAHLEKQIPAQAGLGGGSADAAAALLAMASFWDIPEDDSALLETAAELGSDMPFFLRGGCGLYTGTGSTFEHGLQTISKPVVLVKPPVGVPTREAYAAFDSQAQADKLPRELLAQAVAAKEASQVPLFNNLSDAAQKIAPELTRVHEWLEGELSEIYGTRNSDGISRGPLLTGSGSAVFAIADSFSHASSIAAAAFAQGWWARATTFSRIRSAVVEARR